MDDNDLLSKYIKIGEFTGSSLRLNHAIVMNMPPGDLYIKIKPGTHRQEALKQYGLPITVSKSEDVNSFKYDLDKSEAIRETLGLPKISFKEDDIPEPAALVPRYKSNSSECLDGSEPFEKPKPPGPIEMKFHDINHKDGVEESTIFIICLIVSILSLISILIQEFFYR